MVKKTAVKHSDAVEDETVADNAGAGGVDAGAGGDTEANGVQEKDSKESKESKESKQNGNSANSKSEINENGVVVEVVAEDDAYNQSRPISTLSTTSKASRTSSTNSTNSTNSYNQQKQKKQEEMDRFENSEKRQATITSRTPSSDPQEAVSHLHSVHIAPIRTTTPPGNIPAQTSPT